MTIDAWLFVILGIVQTWTAVQGGIVSARALSPGRERNFHLGIFVVLGAMGIGLITWQAINVSHAEKEAGRQEQQLQSKLNGAQEKLDKALEGLNSSLLAQERMKGQLDALSMMAGKIGQSSSNDMKQVVSAITKVAEQGRVAALTNKQLCDRTFDLTKRLRAFGKSAYNTDMNSIMAQQGEMVSAKTEDERKAIWQKRTQEESQRWTNTELEFRSTYVAEAIYLRDEIIKRLPSVPEPSVEQKMMFRGMSGGSWGIFGGADYLEILARTLCSQ